MKEWWSCKNKARIWEESGSENQGSGCCWCWI